MTALVFIALMAFSVVLAFMAKRGVIADSMDDVMVAGRSFGAFMVFFVTVGETYGIGTMIGVPISLASIPRTKPSVMSMAMHRTTLSPRCWATSTMRLSG